MEGVDWFFCSFFVGTCENDCVEPGKYRERLLTLVLLMSACNRCFDASTNRYSCVQVVGFNVCWFSTKNINKESIPYCVLI